MSEQKSALFVCLGNICRSPIAEAVFRKLVNERGLSDKWIIDSAATADYHTGKNPDRRAQKCMKDHDVSMNHRARPVQADDFRKFNFIFGMDESNISDLKHLAPKDSTAKIELLGDYDPEGPCIIRDPYYLKFAGRFTGKYCYTDSVEQFELERQNIFFSSVILLGLLNERNKKLESSWFQNLNDLSNLSLDEDSEGFEEVYQQCMRCCKAFLDKES